MPKPPSGGRLERAIARWRRLQVEDDQPLPQRAAAFRAIVHERLRNLERDVGDLKGRLNGLIFVVLGAVITQVLLRLLA